MFCDDSAVPDRVKIGRLAKERNVYVISPSVVIVCVVKRLVQVTDKMNNKLERFSPLRSTLMAIGQVTGVSA